MLESAAMPLPVSEVERELTHTRPVRYEGYKRTDGLWDIEAHLPDTKNHDLHLKTGVRPPGRPRRSRPLPARCRKTPRMDQSRSSSISAMRSRPPVRPSRSGIQNGT